MGAPRQGRSGWYRTFAGRPSLGRRLDGQDARCLLHPGLPEGDGRGRRDAGSDRRRHLLRQPYCRRQRRLRVSVCATALLRPALRFGVGAHSGQREVAHRADAPAQIQFRASGLNLVIAALVFWNSTYIADAIAHLRATEQSVPDAWLAHTSPLSWEHISFSGDFLWERATATADKRRPLNLGQPRVAA